VVFEAVHRRPETALFWHLDDEFLAVTRHFHQVALSPGPGEHRLLLIDEDGHRLERRFRVLNRGR
jgi:penicillin-binding protein 1C